MPEFFKEQFPAVFAVAARRNKNRPVEENTADILLQRFADALEEPLSPRAVDTGIKIGAVHISSVVVRADLHPVRVLFVLARFDHMRIRVEDNADAALLGIGDVLLQNIIVFFFLVKAISAVPYNVE